MLPLRFVFTLLGTTTGAASDGMSKFLGRQMTVLQMQIYQYIAAILFLFVLVLFRGEPIVSSQFVPLIYTVLMGAGVGFASHMFFLGMVENSTKTMVVTAFNSHIAAVLFAIFFLEYDRFLPSTLSGITNILALVVSACAVYLIAHAKISGKEKETTASRKWLLYAALCVPVIAVSKLIQKYLLVELSPLVMNLFFYIGVMAYVVAVSAAQGKIQKLVITRYTLLALLKGLLTACRFLFFFIALSMYDGSLVTLVNGVGAVVLMTIIGHVCYGEGKTMGRLQYLGIGLGICSIVLMAI